MTKIISIVYQPKDQKYEEGRFEDFIRVPVETADLVENYGIAGDAKGRKGSHRQVNLLSTPWLAERKAEGYRTAPGEFGEQLIIEGMTLLDLPVGTKLQVGDAAVLEVTAPRSPCTRLGLAQGMEDTPPVGPAGILARVLTSGPIQVGDSVTVFLPEPA